MNCKKCGTPLVSGEQICKGCGASIVDQNASNQNVVGQASPVQPTVSQGTAQQVRPVQPSNQGVANQNVTRQASPVQPTVNQGMAQQVRPVQPSNQSVTNQTVIGQASPVQPTVSQGTVQPTRPVQATTSSQPMTCKRCGTPLTSGEQFCRGCGMQVNSGVSAQPQNMNNNSNNFNSSTSSNYGQNNGNQNNMQQIIKYVVIGIVAVIIVVAGIFGAKAIMKNNEEPSNETSNVPTYKVNFQGFLFKIPSNYMYEKEGDTLMIGDEESTWMAQIKIMQGSFTKLERKKASLKPTLEQQGYTVSNVTSKDIDGVSFIVLEITYQGLNGFLTYAKVNSTNIAVVTLFNKDNEFDYSLLEKVAPIFKDATYTGETNNIKLKSNFGNNIVK